MGEPIEIEKIRVGDRIRVVNPVDDMTFTVTEITPTGDGFRFIHGGTPRIFGGRPGVQLYNQFFLVDRPSRTEARGLAELIALGKDTKGTLRRVQDPLRAYVPGYLGLKKKTGKGRRATRRRKTRKSRR